MDPKLSAVQNIIKVDHKLGQVDPKLSAVQNIIKVDPKLRQVLYKTV